ncbi:uncharacterized protein A1O9_00217 [Exophiala aquamarina CBS 119918]|uniref:Uncharacterized protein n=1 Tax=Exophiala aquamarina CBS 119918 TaxID=1182545 RepID=A0A072Q2X2_9EURO|nr:uncharacterized protein A1O9_00217 [Exophiala aquamarina CBS 119918]KEF62245.1 hypothetical protein A1O9_00217 [Exophiala aquamarina CBS 119918]
MEYEHEIPQSTGDKTSPPAPTLQVDFSWKQFRSIITDQANPSEPIYNVHYSTFRSPHLTFKSADDKEVIGTGTLQVVSINAKYEVHGHAGTLKALKRLKTQYTHLSYAYSDDPDNPVPMNWKSSCGLKRWDFICMDEAQNPVAKFSVNIWALRKLGHLEFLGDKVSSNVALRDELVVTGFTLFYMMYLRANNILSLFGAAFARPGPIDIEKEKDKEKEKEQRKVAG